MLFESVTSSATGLAWRPSARISAATSSSSSGRAAHEHHVRARPGERHRAAAADATAGARHERR